MIKKASGFPLLLASEALAKEAGFGWQANNSKNQYFNDHPVKTNRKLSHTFAFNKQRKADQSRIAYSGRGNNLLSG